MVPFKMLGLVGLTCGDQERIAQQAKAGIPTDNGRVFSRYCGKVCRRRLDSVNGGRFKEPRAGVGDFLRGRAGGDTRVQAEHILFLSGSGRGDVAAPA
jgi:hypothetical protein